MRALAFVDVTILAAISLGVAACGGDDDPARPTDTGPTADTASPDVGPPLDTGPRDAGSDMGMDAGPRDAGRDMAVAVDSGPAFDAGLAGEGQGFVTSAIALASEGHALSFAAPTLNPILADSLATGEFIALVEVLGVDDRFWAMDDEVGIAMYQGQDTDSMPGNNFSGMARLVPAPPSLDMGHPISLLRGEIAAAQVLTGRGARLDMTLSGFGSIEVHDVEVEVTVIMDESDPTAVRGLGAQPGRVFDLGQIRGAVPAVVLERLPNMTGLGMDEYPSLLRLIAGFFGREGQPDADLDGDGLEHITVRMGDILSCTDGDGTEITGSSCIGDERIADGYTVAFDFAAVTAIIVPLMGTP